MSVNQNLKPITLERKNNLCLGGCDLVELAHNYGTPLYVIDEVTLRTTAKEYINAFKDYPNIKMLYASKALCNLTISKILLQEGFSFDAVSIGELYTLKKAGVNLADVLFNGNNKTEEELKFALENNIGRISVDNFEEAKLLNKLAFQMDIYPKILLRITPGIECHTHEYIQTGQTDSKFGFDMLQIDDIIKLIINEYKNLNLVGLHAHIGSQIFELKSFEDEIDILTKEVFRIKNAYNLELNELNIGGGLGVKYVETDSPTSIEEFAQVVINSVKKSCDEYSVKEPIIYIEPGRSVISTSGVTLYKVGTTKQVPHGRKYVAVDGGMGDNPRHALYQAEYSAEICNDVKNREE
ncbi:MAG: diaminopimelate decarboxylase, partial [bacterium]|nr:diaminopimelate decarboxylase [bacterium]